jgi:hypothetical protein
LNKNRTTEELVEKVYISERQKSQSPKYCGNWWIQNKEKENSRKQLDILHGWKFTKMTIQ